MNARPDATADIPDRGFLYLVWGAREYFDEAMSSCRSLKAVSPRAHATIAVDTLTPELESELSTVFDLVVPAETVDHGEFGGSRRARHLGFTFKVRNIYSASPYERTCFLDTDVHFVEPIDGLFDLLDYCDLAIAPAPGDIAPTRNREGTVVPGFTPYNTGVVFYRKDRTKTLFDRWEELQDEVMASTDGRGGPDQETFAAALLQTTCRFYVLQTSWNARLSRPERFAGPVRVVHARAEEMGGLAPRDAAVRVNRTNDVRVWVPEVGEVVHSEMGLYRWLIVSVKGIPIFFRRDLSRLTRKIRRVVRRGQ